MLQQDRIWMAQGENACYLLLNQANRHGIIAGASGTGKTVTLKVMAEGFSHAGVPVFMADVKGDVVGMAEEGKMSDGLAKRMPYFDIDPAEFPFRSNPVRVWDMLGDEGIPVRVTISDMGPTLLARLLGLTEVQEGVLNIIFHVADDHGMLLIDLKDLRAMLAFVADNAKEFESSYGRVSSASVGAIQRKLLALADQGGDVFFGEPNIDLSDWFDCAPDGRGFINILNASRLINQPQVYAMFLLWMLSHLFETLPEVGDPDKPRFVFFFDEAHLLFDGMPKALTDKIVQVVKLIRSKGVGVYFITQSPSDIPNDVLAQLSNRVQHGLRAYTPAEQKAVRAAAASFRARPGFDAAAALQELGTGEALVSFLDEDGKPCMVERARVLPPQCLMAAPSPETLSRVYAEQRDLMDAYGEPVDRESAYEIIEEQREASAEEQRLAAERAAFEKEKAAWEKQRALEEQRAAKEAEREAARQDKEEQRLRAAEEKAAERERIAAEKEAERQRIAAEKEAAKKQAEIGKLVSRFTGNVIGALGRQAGSAITRGLFGTKR